MGERLPGPRGGEWTAYLDLVEGDAGLWVLPEKTVEETDEGGAGRVLIAGAASARRDAVGAHGVLHGPVEVADGVVEAPFCAGGCWVGGEWGFSKEEAVEGDAEGPDIDGFGDGGPYDGVVRRERAAGRRGVKRGTWRGVVCVLVDYFRG